MLSLALTWVVLSARTPAFTPASMLTCEPSRGVKVERVVRERHRRPIARPFTLWLRRFRAR